MSTGAAREGLGDSGSGAGMACSSESSEGRHRGEEQWGDRESAEEVTVALQEQSRGFSLGNLFTIFP